MYSRKQRDINDKTDNYADIITLNPTALNVVIPKKIWMYWEGNLPQLVEKCILQIKKKNPNYEVYVLNPENIKEFCNIDDPYFENTTPQQKADLIRFYLIYHYGGIWLDASTLVYENLNWIEKLVVQNQTSAFAYYRAKNTTHLDFPVLENWLLASVEKNLFFKYWFDELFTAIKLTPKQYIQNIRQTEQYPEQFFQRIGNLEYLVAYVACQKVMRQYLPSITLINCDKNALFFQVKNKWVKEKILIDLAINHPADEYPKLIKLAGKERNYLCQFYNKGMYFKGSFLDI